MQPLIVDNLPNPSASYHVKVYEKPGFHLPWHMHNTYELTQILQGNGQRIVGSHIGAFRAGDMLLLAPNVPHAWKNHTQGGRNTVRAITLKFSQDYPIKDFLNLPEMSRVVSLLTRAERGLIVRGNLRERVSEKLKDLAELPSYRQLLGILDILITISESNETSTLLPGDTLSAPTGESSKTQMVIDYIFEHYTHSLDATSLAKVANIHPSSLGRMFKRTTGITPTEFINQVRINLACQLLSESQLSILDICHNCGYQNLSYFNRVFKQLHGCSPSQYRDQLLGHLSQNNNDQKT